MTVHLDTSALIQIVTGARPLLGPFEAAVSFGHRVATSSLVMYEWLRGPRIGSELELQRELCPPEYIVIFGPAEAARAADLHKGLKRARSRDLDIAIAACAIEHGAALWTQNPEDFQDLPGLRLYQP